MRLSGTDEELQTRVWHVGDVRVTQVVETTMTRPLPVLFPDATPAHWTKLPWLWPDSMTGSVDESAEGRFNVKAYILEVGDQVIVIDTGYGNDKIRHVYAAGHQLATDFMERMTAAGASPERVDIVVSTHLHVDHVGWNTTLVGSRWEPTFPNARYLMNDAELDHWASITGEPGTLAGDQAQVFKDSIQPILDAGLADRVPNDHKITPEVELVPTPGHTPGHSCVRIASRGHEAWILGDLSHHPIQVPFPELFSGGDADRDQAIASRKYVWGRLTGNRILVLGPHWPGDAGFIVRDEDGPRLGPAH